MNLVHRETQNGPITLPHAALSLFGNGGSDISAGTRFDICMCGKYLSGCVGLSRLNLGEFGRDIFLTSIVLFHGL